MKTNAALAALLLTFFSAAASARDFRTVALSGDQAPGAAAGVNFGSLLGVPRLNASGQTAFSASLAGPGVDGTNDRGIYSEGSGTLAEVARTGGQAPGAAAGVNFSDLFGVTTLNASGQTVIIGRLTGSGVDGTNDIGIYSEGSGALAEVARSGGQAPGAAAGVNFRFDNDTNFLPIAWLNASGQTTFSTLLTGAGVDGTNDTGIYREGSGVLAPVAREGDQAPGAADGVNFFFDNGFPPRPVLNASGQTAFLGQLTGTGVDGTNGSGVYREGSGVLAPVARAGDQAPGAAAGVNFSGLSDPAINGSGQTAFLGRLTGAGVDGTNDRGVYSEGSGVLAPVARAGDQAPGAAAGVNFRGFNNPAINGSGQTAFVGRLTGAGVDGTNDSGVYSEGSGVLAPVARLGEQAPGAAAGVNFSGFSNPAINGSGQTAFAAFLTTGVGVAGGLLDRGIYATDPDGLLVEIAREGSLFDVNDDPLVDDFRTIRSLSFFANTGNADGLGSGFNDSGQLVFRANFTDGSTGIFVSNLVAVPEPGSLALLALGGAGLLTRWRRR